MSKQILVQDVTPPAKGDTSNSDLYAKCEKIYTQAFTGTFRRLRVVGGVALLLLYLGTVWLNWSGRQAVWWDLPERKFYIFGVTFWPQDLMLLFWLLIVCAFGLFFITVFVGHVWCGYTCPQSVWTWIYMWCEEATEDDRSQHIKLDRAPMSGNKPLRKTAKHSLWLLIGSVTGLIFVGYFPPVRELIPELLTDQVDGQVYFWAGFFTLATYGNAGWLREQVCTYMCPYARFQSVMFDRDTLIVSYDPHHGEKRGPRRKSLDYKAQGPGDCIDCTMCVQICPTGIDIRDGLQTECIDCAAYIDACDSIMGKMNYPKGLISYTTEHNLNGQETYLVRLHPISYVITLVSTISVLIIAVVLRPLVGLDVSEDHVFHRENELGRTESVYSPKITNKDQQDHTYILGVKGPGGLTLEGRCELKVAAGDILNLPMELSIEPEKLPLTTNEIVFAIESADGPSIYKEARSRFIGPRTR